MLLRRLAGASGLACRTEETASSRLACITQRRCEHSRSESTSDAVQNTEPSQGKDKGKAIPAERKLRRKDYGSYADYGDMWDKEVEDSTVWPGNVPLYSPLGTMKFFTEPSTEVTADLNRLAKAVKEDNLEEMMEVLQHSMPDMLSFAQAMHDDEVQRKDPSACILHWETHMVLHTGPVNEPHPLDKKVKCRVYLRDLQRQTGLSDAALQHIALICGPRYNRAKGLLTLTSTRYADREANRRHVVRMLDMLVEAGRSYSAVREPRSSRELQQAAA